MRTVVLFIAMSLDGYIADSTGGVGWLSGQENDGEIKDTYSEFIKEIDTVIMGWNTYHQIVTELSPQEWVYSGMTSYVLTHRKIQDTEEIKFTENHPCELVQQLRREQGKGIWICGGAYVVHQLMEKNLIDRFHISLIPTLLGNGIRLFGTLEQEQRLKLIRTETYNGIVELVYHTVHTANAADSSTEQ